MDWKKMFHKSRIYPVVLVLVAFGVYKYRQYKFEKKEEKVVLFQGVTMGTVPYKVVYKDENKIIYSSQIDSLLKEFNQVFSTYIDSSDISEFNKNLIGIPLKPWIREVHQRAKAIYDKTDGYFDPTVMSLVRIWGFADKHMTTLPDSSTIDSLRKFVGYENILIRNDSLVKRKPGVMVDYSAIAKGYAVDIVVGFLRKKGLESILVEIGGEVRLSGKLNPMDEPWVTLIQDPESETLRAYAQVKINDELSTATSGNYRNIRIIHGKKFAHTISPKTGYPYESKLISATVIMKDCIDADAYATALIAMGLDRASEFVKQQKDFDYLLMYYDKADNLQYMSSRNLEKKLKFRDE